MQPSSIQRKTLLDRLAAARFCVALVVINLLAAAGRCQEPPARDCRVVEIARGHSWVSPYWGYSAPKIAFDGSTYYTTGLWGDAPDSAAGVIYKFTGDAWTETYRFPGVYQPAVLLLDSERRLIVIYSRQEQPAVFLRAYKSGTADRFAELPPPPDMQNAFYIGAAIQNDHLYVAYVTTPTYSMYLAVCDLARLVWERSVLVSEGQVSEKPKTAWTYPILIPAQTGLHLVASNCPDGGEGNTYNQVRYTFLPRNSSRQIRHELVAESPVGCNAYAMDAVVDRAGDVHVVHMWNVRKYGPDVSSDLPTPGVYHARRSAATGAWRHTRIADVCIAGLYRDADGLSAAAQESGTITLRRWDAETETWNQAGAVCDRAAAPVPPAFMDLIHAAGGSDMSRGLAIVTDGIVPESGERVLWALLPR